MSRSAIDPAGNIREDMLTSYLNELCSFFKGPKRAVDPRPIRSYFQKEDYKSAVRQIRDSLGLQSLENLTIAKVKSGGIERASAWIEFPHPPPPFGTTEFKRMRVVLYLRMDYIKREPFELVIKSIAHEFCHVVLHMLGHRLLKSEEATDLTAMIFGYHDFYLKGFEEVDRRSNGREQLSHESRADYITRMERINSGYNTECRVYLSTSEVRFAHQWITSRLRQ